jgi:2-dehydropantoate 2-reductase
VKVAVVGAGAIGSLVGGLLTEAGADVWLVDVRQDHVDAITGQGLKIDREGSARRVRARATTDPGEVGRVDLIVVLVKSTDTSAVVETVQAVAGPDSLLLTLQNGLGNAEILADTVEPARVMAGTTSHGVTLLGPGHIRHAGVGPTVIGMWSGGDHARAVDVARFLTESGIDTTADEGILAVLWDKLFVVVGVNAITALTGIKTGGLLEREASRRLVRAAVEEAVAVALARGVEVRADPIDHVFGVIQATAQNRTSMGQDVDNKRQTEIGAINGAVVREAEKLGVDAPINRTLTTLVETLQANYRTTPPA